MSFDSFAAFLAMGGHGLYVWLSYGAFVLVVAANVAGVRLARKRYFRLARAIARRPAPGSTVATSADGGSPTNKQTNTPA